MGRKDRMNKWTAFKVWFRSLFYHHSFSWDYAMDTALDPFFAFVDNFSKHLGRMFVALVIFLIGSVTAVVHSLGLPYYQNKSPMLTYFLVIYGYWILINLTYNFYKAISVSPGVPDHRKSKRTVGTTLCKKCINPKPPRTHHCSICSKCYLKMDHHCPWMNNCIGHFNHRYFYLTIVFIALGCSFVVIFGAQPALQSVIFDEDIFSFNYRYVENKYVEFDPTDEKPLTEDEQYERKKNGLIDFALKVSPTAFTIIKAFYPGFVNEMNVEKVKLFGGFYASRVEIKVIVLYTSLIVIGALIALIFLLIMHGKLITRGETSVEYYINRAESRKPGSTFVNPYDRGWKENWKFFLGLDVPSRSLIFHVLLPSSHLPTGDGYDWSHLTNIHCCTDSE